MTPFIGEIKIFAGNFAPEGWLFCQGQMLNVSQYQTLFAVIGTIYGGDGQRTFQLPNLQAYAPMGQGAGPGLTPRQIGKPTGKKNITLAMAQMPPHKHDVAATNATGNSSDPTNRIWAKNVSTPAIQPYGQTVVSPVTMHGDAIGPSSSTNTEPHDNMQPYLGINFIIAWDGEYPPRP